MIGYDKAASKNTFLLLDRLDTGFGWNNAIKLSLKH
jgi:hypothetical protein